MPFGLYMDVHLPISITEGLRRRGIDVLTCQEDGTRTEYDEIVLDRAAAQNRLLVMQDQDFLQIAADWPAAGRQFSGIVFAPQMGLSIGRLIEDLELIAKCARVQEVQNRIVYIPLD